MEEAVSLQAETMEDDILKIQFNGRRDINNVIDNWLRVRSVDDKEYENILIIDNMAGKIGPEGICLLAEILSEYDFYRRKRIAIVLKEENSYSTRFFEIIAKNWGIKTKHFNTEKEAVKWLCLNHPQISLRLKSRFNSSIIKASRLK